MRQVLLAAAVFGLAATLAGCEDDEPEAGDVADAAAEPSALDDVDVVAEGVAEGNPDGDATRSGLTVRGEGRVTGEPDVLRVTVGVEHREADPDDAISAMNTDIDAVIEALLAEGVAEEDLQTARLAIRPEIDRDRPDGTAETVGYRAQNTVEARVRDLDAVGSVLEAAIDAGGEATTVQGVRFALADNEERLERARQEAVAEARRRAEQYADAAGVALGALEEITELTSDRPQPVQDDVAAEVSEQAAAGPRIEPGEEEVGVSVQVRWSLTEAEE